MAFSADNSPQVAVFCDLCQSEDEVISWLCLVCNEYMCRSCSVAHQRSRASNQHQIIHLNGENDEEVNALVKQNGEKEFCTVHPEDDLNCQVNAQKQHEILKVKDARNKLQKQQQEINNLIGCLRPAVKKLELRKREIIEQNHNMTRRNFIKTHNAIQLISNKRDQVNKQNNRIVNNDIAIIEKKENKLQQVITDLDQLQASVHNEAIQNLADSEVIQTRNKVKDIVSQINPEEFDISRLSPVPLQEVQLGSMFGITFDNSNTNIVSRLKITAHPNGTIWSVCPISQSQAWVHIYADFPNYLINLSGEVEKIVPCQSYVTKFAITNDRKNILSSSYYNMSIKMMSLNCDLQNDFRTGKQMQYPLGFCITGNGEVLVCMNKRDDSTDNIMTIRRFTGNGEVVRTISYQSEYLQTDSVRGTNNIAENPVTEDICLIERCDKNQGNLVILDKNGKKKATYRGRNQHNEFDPFDIICDERGQIILADRHKTIHLLSQDGQFLQYIISKEEGIVPFCLALDSVYNQLWIGCDEGTILVCRHE